MDVWALRVWDFFRPGTLCAVTLPGHELHDFGPIAAAMKQIEWEMRAWADRQVIGSHEPEDSLGVVADTFRRHGVPASRAYFDGEAIQVEVVEPVGGDGGECEVAGHVWAPAGGGLLVCLRCESEKWADG
jgi:hypothetical protein